MRKAFCELFDIMLLTHYHFPFSVCILSILRNIISGWLNWTYPWIVPESVREVKTLGFEGCCPSGRGRAGSAAGSPAHTLSLFSQGTTFRVLAAQSLSPSWQQAEVASPFF